MTVLALPLPASVPDAPSSAVVFDASGPSPAGGNTPGPAIEVGTTASELLLQPGPALLAPVGAAAGAGLGDASKLGDSAGLGDGAGAVPVISGDAAQQQMCRRGSGSCVESAVSPVFACRRHTRPGELSAQHAAVRTLRPTLQNCIAASCIGTICDGSWGWAPSEGGGPEHGRRACLLTVDA